MILFSKHIIYFTFNSYKVYIVMQQDIKGNKIKQIIQNC
jgi:hypothetical protein